MQKLLIFIAALFLIIPISHAQQLEQVDEKVASYKNLNFSSIEEVASKISLDFKTDMEKARAVYSYVAQNISYDYVLMRRGNMMYYKGSNRKERKLEEEMRYIKVAEKTFETRNAVCEGYACLFQRLCELTDLESVIIEGYSKTVLEDIAKKSPISDHAWNSVKVGNDWVLVDATWGAGTLDGQEFIPDFNDSFFNTAPERFGLNHYAENKGLFSFIGRRKFFQQPLFHEPYMKSDIKIVSPSSGILKIKKGEAINLRLASDSSPKDFIYNFSRDEYASELIFKKRDNFYEAIIPKQRRKSKSLTIYHKNVGMVSYRLDFK